MIFIHEFGHFFTAKLAGVRVNEFAMGMGPLLCHFEKGGTQYSLRLFPIGGFCAMEGEDEDSADEQAFNNKPVWKRILVVVMGAVMNILLGLVLMMVLLGQQPVFNSTTIAQFTPNSALQAAGLKTGDTFVSVDQYRIYGDKDLTFALATANPKAVDIEIRRGKKLVRFNDVKFHSRSVKGKNYVTLDFYVQPVLKNAGTLIAKSAQDTVSTVRMVWYSLIGLLTGKYGINDMAGPIGMADVVGQAVTEGLKQNFIAGLNNVIYIMMMVTVNLGVFNLVPFPALDGGKLLFLIVEAVRRKPIQAKYQGAVEAAGFCILIGFMLLVCYSDILRLVTGKGLGG
ncbi:MAG TPA: RIP metalloprotease RseP [Ruminococcaceae bacterium]|jgi:regulator of sigma E protease|nr:RIP metalloprotease RseP [Oscillospiraceae bacterium]HBG55588.1 RIP metalloprotease RseP [Oscillospiraceae bacterium]HBQ47044.1 RIP metalloprotease RseP [Oscillospiraceae bacterium]HBT91557.1 RIP metalloprotease RseP [Oscillospiraceae bacterium]HCB91232.1 RIP metalloprotease RseP [Oscillospiraceae bacterium]